MKRILCLLGCATLLLFLVNSCGKDTNFDASLLPGKWQDGQYYEKYFSDGTGYFWDEAEDVSESDAQTFTWELSKNELTQIHDMEMGKTKVPWRYTVTELTASTFKYNGRSFKRVN
jgi:hypothetical protein